LGHITHKFYSVNQALKQFFFIAELVSVELVDQESDFVIKSGDIKSFKWQNQKQLSSGLCRMTLIKYPEKHSIPTLLIWLKRPHCFFRESGIQHLLIDLPSVDKEKDEGKLLAHKAF
jgi:hypothetical protein